MNTLVEELAKLKETIKRGEEYLHGLRPGQIVFDDIGGDNDTSRVQSSSKRSDQKNKRGLK